MSFNEVLYKCQMALIVFFKLIFKDINLKYVATVTSVKILIILTVI
jgi:hypothetical protein